eukprot:scaffold1727_cov133-Cylindrotheca_fusiformis.AAC.23
MSSTIRPISRRFPNSRALWDETNLPMCAILTPYPPSSTDNEDGDDDDLGLRLCDLLRCLKCGAPHPTTDTYGEMEDQDTIVCYLCGDHSSSELEEQKKVRSNDGMDDMIHVDWPYRNGTKRDTIVQLPLFNQKECFDASAKACPPVWWIVLDGSMPQSSPYWKTVTECLQNILIPQDESDDKLQELARTPPEYVHIGLILASHDILSTWDLSSPVPKVCHFPMAAATGNSKDTKNYSTDNIAVDLSLAPMDAMHKPCIQAALRAVGDNPSAKNSETTAGMALGATMETILEFMEQAKHPGDSFVAEKESKGTPALQYAGGKITCLLGRPPLEIQALPVESQPSFGAGGIAGAIHDPLDSKKFTDAEDGDNKEDSSELTPSNLAKYCEPLEPTEDVFDIIGTRCAHAALGIDIIVVEPQSRKAKEESTKDKSAKNRQRSDNLFLRPFYGIPLLRVLSDTSGAPGPILVSSVNDLTNQVWARTPWQLGVAFATEVRVRATPGWSVEDSPVEPLKNTSHQLAVFLSSAGVSGPAIATNNNFYLLGTCDNHTSVTLDFQVTHPTRKINLEQKLFGVRRQVGPRFILKPVIQTCIAYTCIEKDYEGKDVVVRKMRVSCCPMPMVTDVESIYNALDPEALVAALFQKLSLNVYEEGLESTQQVGIDWLKSLLVCVYQSALNKVENEGRKKVGLPSGYNDDDNVPFDASDRILMSTSREVMTLSSKKKSEGRTKELEVDDVLLGLGHDRIASMSLIVFALLQSDALRPSSNVSVDARCAAIAQMASMTPQDLVKCVAPSLSLWSSLRDECIVESIDLSLLESIKAYKKAYAERNDDLVFVLDSPQQVLVYKATLKQEPKKFKLGLKPFDPLTLKLGTMVDNMIGSYRTEPFCTAGDQSEHSSYRRFLHTMIEDFPMARNGDGDGSNNFKEWRLSMAQAVQT